MTSHFHFHKIEPIEIEDRYPFKSSRYQTTITYVKLSYKDKQELHQRLREMYPIGAPGQDIIKSYVQRLSCQFCLQYGHICEANVYPSSCPNLPNDYLNQMDKLSRKYGIEKDILNYLLMTGVGNIPPYEVEGAVPGWSWYHFEKQLNDIQCKYCYELYHDKEKCPKFKEHMKQVKNETKQRALNLANIGQLQAKL